MEIRQLKYFIAVVDSGSLSRAAQQVFIAQSALSKQVAELEDELKVKLLTRGRSGVTPTEAGKIFYEYAQAIQKQICDARAAVHLSPDSIVGTVVVAMPQSVSPALALPLIRAARERLPNVALHHNEELTGNLLEQLRQGRVDIMIFTPNVPVADFSFDPFMEEDFYLIHSPAYARAPAHGDVSLAEAASHPLVFPSLEHSHCTRFHIEQCMAESGFNNLRIANEINSVHTLKGAVEAGGAATIMPVALATHEVASGRLIAHRIAAPGMFRTLGLCMSSRIPGTTAKRAVASLIIDVADELCRSGEWAGARPITASPQAA